MAAKRIKLNPDISPVGILFREQLEIPHGWKEEIYFNRKTRVLSFSDPLTQNTWTEDPEKVGEIESISISDFEGYKEITDSNFCEVDDRHNETDQGFNVPDYERFYQKSSIVPLEEAIDRLSDYGIQEEWFTGIRKQIEKPAKWMIRYKVYSNVMGVRQNTANFDLTNVPDVSIYSHVTEKARERFAPYDVKLNHAGKTITVNYR